MFRNREDAGLQVAARLQGRPWRDPLVLAIPRGGVVVGAVLARELGADLDVVLARKLRAPGQPELALGAISEDGEIYLSNVASEYGETLADYLAEEQRHQLAEIARRQQLFRQVRSQASLKGRSILVTDDGIATGSTMVAALHVVAGSQPHEVIVAVPVASPDRLVEIRRHCDEVVCVLTPRNFWAIGQFYEDFTQVQDEEVVALLQPFARRAAAALR